MAHALVEGYLAERDQLLNTINVMKDTATSRGGDPSETELEAMSKAYKRIDKLDELIAIVGEDRTMDEETRRRLEGLPNSGNDGAIKYRSSGELLWDCLHANFGSQQKPEDQEAQRRWGVVMKRAADHMGTKAADTTATAGDVAGLYVAPVVGPIIDILPKGQPFLSAIGKTPAPDAMTFVRPRIVDPDFANGNGAGVQSAEKAELASAKFDVKVDNVTLDTVGGYLNVSQQLLSLQPGAWDLILRQLGRRVAYQGELAALTALALADDPVDLPAASVTDSTAVLGALFEAAAKVFTNTGALPTWIAYGPLGWQMLGSLTDAADRPLFPFLGAANSMGTASLGDFGLGPLGLRQIVTPGIADNKIWMGNDLALEAYSYPFPVLEAIEPSVLGRQVAVAEALAFFRPITDETGPKRNGAVAIYDVTP